MAEPSRAHSEQMKPFDLNAVFLSCLSGILLCISFPLIELPLFAWVALVPLLVAVRDKGRAISFRLGFLCGLVHYLGTLYWLRIVMEQYGGIPPVLAVVLVILLCAYLALYVACFAVLASFWQDRYLFWIWLLPSAWVALEWVRAHAVSGFPWASLGYSQTPFSILTQVADVTGVYGVSWLLVLANTCLAHALVKKRFHWNLAAFALCLALVLLYGSQRLQTVGNSVQHAAVWRAGIIQGNIDQSQKWDPAFQQQTLNRYRNLSLEAAQHNPPPDLLVWPETAAPFFYGIEEKLTREVQVIAQEAHVPLLFGSPGVGMVKGNPRLFNRAYLIDSYGNPLGRYAKRHLVPFGEYVPLQKILFFVHKLVEAAGDFSSGGSQPPLRLNDQELGVLICYEAIFPELARSSVEQGASVLVNITNDAWFGTSSAPYQHLEMARWRAIEFRRPLVRAANTGISSAFEATGKQCGIIPLGKQGVLVCALHPLHMQSFYARWGDVFAAGCFLTVAAGLLYILMFRKTT